MIASDRVMEPFLQGHHASRTATPSAGTRSSAAVALANLDIFEEEGSTSTCWRTRAPSGATLEKLLDLPIVGDVRGDGYFYGIELVKDKATKETFDDDESERLLRGFLSQALFEAGLYCRADDRGDPVIQLAPPLIVRPGRVRRDRADPALGAHRGPREVLSSAVEPSGSRLATGGRLDRSGAMTVSSSVSGSRTAVRSTTGGPSRRSAFALPQRLAPEVGRRDRRCRRTSVPAPSTQRADADDERRRRHRRSRCSRSPGRRTGCRRARRCRAA